jgi:hypothetical protein
LGHLASLTEVFAAGSTQQICLHARRQIGLRVVLVHQRDVVEDIALLLQHLLIYTDKRISRVIIVDHFLLD